MGKIVGLAGGAALLGTSLLVEWLGNPPDWIIGLAIVVTGACWAVAGASWWQGHRQEAPSSQREVGPPESPIFIGPWADPSGTTIKVALSSPGPADVEAIEVEIGGRRYPSDWESGSLSVGVTTMDRVTFEVPPSIARGKRRATLWAFAGGRWYPSEPFPWDFR